MHSALPQCRLSPPTSQIRLWEFHLAICFRPAKFLRTPFIQNLGTSFADAGLSLAGDELANLIVPSNGIVSQILGSVGAIIGSAFLGPIGTFIGSTLGTLLGDLGDLFGYRGR